MISSSDANQPHDWKIAYFEHLLAHDETNASRLKAEALGKLGVLYRYRPLSGFGLDELISGLVYLAKPDQLNDPYESTLLLNHKGRYTGGSVQAALQLSEITRETRLAAFCETAGSLLMWAHYANRPKGCCLEFAVEDLLKDEQLARGLHPAIYAPTLWDANSVVAGSKEDLQPILLRSACHKLASWSYEREWRLTDLRLHAPSTPPNIIGLPPGFWDENYAAAQSQPIGFIDQGRHFVELPKPRRIIFIGNKTDPELPELKRLVHGLRRLSTVPLAVAELTPDAKTGAELELCDL